MPDEEIKDDLVKDDTGPQQQSDADKADAGERIPSTAEVQQIATQAAQKVQADAKVNADKAAVAAAGHKELCGVMDGVLDGDDGIKDIPGWKRDAIHRAAANRVAVDNPDLDARDKGAVHKALKEATAKIVAEDAGPAAGKSSEDKDDVQKRVAALDGGAGAGGGRSAGQGSGESDKIIAGGFDTLHEAGLTTDGPGWPKENAIDRDTERAADKFLAAAPRD